MKQLSYLLLLSTLINSCGKSPSGSSKNNRDTIAFEAEAEAARNAKDGANLSGVYLAKFSTLNAHVVGTIPGSAQLKRDGEKISAFVRLFAGSPEIAHFQNVHIGKRCPTKTDDTNGDGTIDYPESLAVTGNVIIPLDWDLNSQTSGNRFWPKAFPNGSYEYLKTANFSRFWKDLNAKDEIETDHLTKLRPKRGLSLIGKVVIIQGVAEDKNLPITVAGYKKWKNFQTLPIACGILEASNELPGTDYRDDIPGPVAEVEENQDVPAPTGSGEDPGTGAPLPTPPTNTGGDNDSDSEEDEETDDDWWEWPWDV